MGNLVKPIALALVTMLLLVCWAHQRGRSTGLVRKGPKIQEMKNVEKLPLKPEIPDTDMTIEVNDNTPDKNPSIPTNPEVEHEPRETEKTDAQENMIIQKDVSPNKEIIIQSDPPIPLRDNEAGNLLKQDNGNVHKTGPSLPTSSIKEEETVPSNSSEKHVSSMNNTSINEREKLATAVEDKSEEHVPSMNNTSIKEKEKLTTAVEDKSEIQVAESNTTTGSQPLTIKEPKPLEKYDPYGKEKETQKVASDVESEEVYYAKVLGKQLDACGDLCNVNGSSYKVKLAFGDDVFDRISADVNCPKLFASEYIDTPAKRVPPSRIPKAMLHSFSLDGQSAISYASRIYSEVSINSSVTDWPDSLIQEYLDNLKSGTYKGSYGQHNSRNLLEVAKKYYSGKTILVLGSVTPWVEAILLHAGATHIYTVDHRVIQCNHPKVTPLTAVEFNELYRQGKVPKIAGAVAFGTVVHSGLGRYGDILNPWGDIMAMSKLWCVLQPDAVVAVSTFADATASDVVEWNMRRHYGSRRLPRLFTNYRIMQVYPRTNWQLLFVARKVDPSSTTRIPRYGLDDSSTAAADKDYFSSKIGESREPSSTAKPIEKYDPYGKENATKPAAPTENVRNELPSSGAKEVKPIEKYDPYGKENATKPTAPTENVRNQLPSGEAKEVKPIEKYDPYGKENATKPAAPTENVKNELPSSGAKEVKPIEKYDPYGKENATQPTAPTENVKNQLPSGEAKEVKPIEKYDPYGKGNTTQPTAPTENVRNQLPSGEAKEVKPIEKYDPYGKENATQPTAPTENVRNQLPSGEAKEVKPIEKYDPYGKENATQPTASTGGVRNELPSSEAKEVKPIEKYDPYGKEMEMMNETSAIVGSDSNNKMKPIEKYDPYGKGEPTLADTKSEETKSLDKQT